MSDILNKLRNNIFEQAEIYLQEIGEFAPFASKLNKSGDFIPVGYYDNNEIIDSIKAVEVFEETLFKDGDVDVVAIGINVSIEVKGEQRDALLLKISNDGENWEESYYVYNIIENQVVWG